MHIKFTSSTNTTCFSNLKPGDLFRNEYNQGLFVKIRPFKDTSCSDQKAKAVVIRALKNGSRPGFTSGWGDDDQVFPVKSAILTT